MVVTGGDANSTGGGPNAAGGASGGNSSGLEDSGGSASGGLGASDSGGGGSDPATGGAGPKDPRCPDHLVEAFPTLQESECQDLGLTCDLALECSSGTQVFTVTCADGKWQEPATCDKPYNFCPESWVDPEMRNTRNPSVMCEDGEWSVETWLLTVSHPNGPCPLEPPAEDDPCLLASGGTGANLDREHCGFPCPNDTSKWAVFTCIAPEEDVFGVWDSGGACD
jgi:hypothetical protein